MKTLFLGNFGAEEYWRPSSNSALCIGTSVVGSGAVPNGMDELLVLACNEGDRYLVDGGSPPECLLGALRTAGFWCDPALAPPVGPQLSGYRGEPFAVTASALTALTKCGATIEAPAAEVVTRVNSKLWSWWARQEAGSGLGAIARTSSELASVATAQLDQGAAIIKEDFGVGGSGNVVISTPGQLDRLLRSVRVREREGMHVHVVVEPLLPKILDFSSHFFVSPMGEIAFRGLRQTLNLRSRYCGSRALEAAVERRILASGYLSKVDGVIRRVAAEGYFGPVCVDSMVLDSGAVVPVIEINARMSMGLLNLLGDYRVGPRACTLRDLKVFRPLNYVMDCLMVDLSEAGLLPGPATGGVLPIAAAPFNGPRGSSGGRVTCRLFALVIYRDADEERFVTAAFERLLQAASCQTVLVESPECQLELTCSPF